MVGGGDLRDRSQPTLPTHSSRKQEQAGRKEHLERL